jgi:hypothetical protein
VLLPIFSLAYWRGSATGQSCWLEINCGCNLVLFKDSKDKTGKGALLPVLKADVFELKALIVSKALTMDTPECRVGNLVLRKYPEGPGYILYREEMKEHFLLLTPDEVSTYFRRVRRSFAEVAPGFTSGNATLKEELQSFHADRVAGRLPERFSSGKRVTKKDVTEFMEHVKPFNEAYESGMYAALLAA